MYQKKIEKEYGCGMEVTVEVMGGKWKACIINHLSEGKRRPSEIKRFVPVASRRSLENQLSELEQHGVIKKIIYPVMPPKVEYELTDLGKSLLPITRAMEIWGSDFKDRFLELKQTDKT
ncbi:transcriptional regulator, HxlR family [Pedobacter sp. ok626]|uniref:winged helix-turn-helix transcriptional regulator n=1 Tax=Pedobacter sp. ok626 TaxID=1761882 RepID=UPI00088696A7|nr:helix-turn-helix domain-containing protein [Pedobacter sp. ok626]SDL11645.1 transcriptional regulator, HxlR family [Pedobacter sp. ok626]